MSCRTRVGAMLVCACAATILLPASRRAAAEEPKPIKPVGQDGKPLKLDFEDGTLKDWTATGNAFDKQPVKGDTVSVRRPGMKSAHQGEYWIGGFELAGDQPTGTLTSVAFKVTHPWGSFLVAGGASNQTRVELVNAADKKVFLKVVGHEVEDLQPVVVDLQKLAGKEIFIRLVDESSGGWGHLNFDDFEFYDQRPHFPNELDPATAAKNAPPPADAVLHAGLKPSEAIAAMTFQPGFKATMFAAEPDLVQPEAFTIDARGRVWVVEGMTYPRRAAEGKGQDRIIVFEDNVGDGKFHKRTVFIEGLNLVSGIEVGFGGVWVGAAPYLMFIPMQDGDEPKPAGPPKILLDGWGYGDTHEVLNTFCWGPDGWLYGCQGVFTDSNVGKPGADKADRVHLNACVWRYHPTRNTFERFAEGTSNPWGIDFNENGQCITEGCVIPHLWHMIQAGHYQRQGGSHDNPYVFDDIKTIADHLHYAGNAGPHAGNGRSASMGGGHAHAGLMVYLGNSWPEQYRGQAFMNNIHGSCINMDILEPHGSGFIGRHGHNLIDFNDSWSRVINLRYDQDGSVYLIDWYDQNHCHNGDPNAHDRSNGRIYKVSYGDTKTAQVNLEKLSDSELVKLQLNKNDWYPRTARRLLEERAAAGKLDGAAVDELHRLLASPQLDESERLRALWTLHAIGALPPDEAMSVLASGQPYLTAWTIQLLCESGKPPSEAVKAFESLAAQSPSAVVRLYLASATQRMPIEQRWTIVERLLAHGEDAQDHNLPLMYWYALEPLCGADHDRALAMAAGAKMQPILAFAVRRIGAGAGDVTSALVTGLSNMSDETRQLEVLRGLRESFRGRRGVAKPAGWDDLSKKLIASPSAEVRELARALGVAFGDPAAIAETRKVVADPSADVAVRTEAVTSLQDAADPGLPPILQKLLTESAMRSAAMRGLAAFDDAGTADAVLAVYPNLSPNERKDALNTLAARPAYALKLLDAVGAKTIPSADVSADLVRQLRNLHDPKIDKQVTSVWGVLRETPEAKRQRIDQLRDIVLSVRPRSVDFGHGRMLFSKTCAQCHTLFDAGGKVGPELTGSNRGNLDYLLQHVVDPNAVLPNEYRTAVIDTNDGRTITGLVRHEDANSVSVLTTTETLAIPLAQIKTRRLSALGMMPEGLLDNFPDDDIRDLIAYLRSPRQIPLPAVMATPEDAKALFNGRDLAGWEGAEGLWHVENGEIVGKTTTGLPHNEFLKSKLSVGDFRLVCKIKLVPNGANSGFQFHSERDGEFEMKGPQADVGAGWWGKLYEENIRGLIWDKSGESYVKENDWNVYEIVQVGSKLRTAINGHLCVELDDPKIPQSGIFGLQVHAGGPTDVHFKDFDLELNPKFEMKTVK